MNKKFSLFGIILALAIVFMIAGCGKEQTEPVGPLNKTTVTTKEVEVVTITATCIDNDPTVPVGIVPTLEDFPGGLPVCVGGVRVTPGNGPETIVYSLDGITGNDVTITITVGDCGEVMSWSVPDNIVIDKVYAKGGQGNQQNVYTYTTKYPSDGNLHCPVNPSGEYAGFSHIDFCFHYKLSVSKTAKTEYTRTYDWTIDKVGDQTVLTLAVGETYKVNYDVTVDATYIDSDWKVTGTITIFNNTLLDAVITSIEDIAGGVTATLVGFEIPAGGYKLSAGETLEIDYTADLVSAIGGTNTVTVLTSTEMVEGGTAEKDYAFGDPTTEIDECIDVTDNKYNDLGTVCYADLPKTFEYPLPIKYDECGEYEFTNTASFETNDNGVTGSDGWTVNVSVPCAGGCTLTQGYWKTHSENGPAPYDDTWALLADGANTLFLESGASYYEVLWMEPKGGNAWIILSHQYIAAELNTLNEAYMCEDVEDDFNEALVLLEEYDQLGDIPKNQKEDRARAIELYTILDNYNNGLMGTPHCDE
jgi:hypothetical protein